MGDFQHDVYTNDWLCFLKSHCSISNSEINPDSKFYYEYVDSCTVELIFGICHTFDLNAESRYLTLELYQRFLRLYYDKMKKLNYNRWSRGATLKSMIAQVQNQVLVRILSCVQLSSKFCCYATSVNLPKTTEFLESVDKFFSKKCITESELEVFQYLDFSVNIKTLYVYVDGLVSLLRPYIDDTFDATLINIMDLVYLKNRKIFENLRGVTCTQTCPSADEQFLDLFRDKLFYATCIILAGVQIYYGKNGPEQAKIKEEILNNVKWPVDIINVAVNVIYDTVTNDI